jgi:FtsP/CotA-like multicopper oxidase with cupredoxin domain
MVAQISISACDSEVLTRTDQFPGPTIEARSGDTLEIEVFNSAEEEVSLHWHGLHMRGGYKSLS